MCTAASDVKVGHAGTVDTTVSCDGTWQRRGFQSKNGVATVLTVADKTSKVVDTETLSNYCNACSIRRKRMTADEFATWVKSHECENNHDGSAGSMECKGMLNIFHRSETLHQLSYSGYLGDGDSKSHSAVANAEPPIYNCAITKLECCGHVQKRMGRRLPELVKRCKTKTYELPGGKTTKGIGGVNKLTKRQTLRMQGHYGAAIRNNVGNVPQMKRAIWAIWHHRRGDWCPTKSGEGDPNKNRLPDFVCDAIKPVFESLSSPELLEKCAHGGTQNTNEAFHHLIWDRCPKEIFVGRTRLEVAVCDATIVYNDGEGARSRIFDHLSMKPGHFALKCFDALDAQRISKSDAASQSDTVSVRRRRAIERAQLNTNDSYASGAFHSLLAGHFLHHVLHEE